MAPGFEARVQAGIDEAGFGSLLGPLTLGFSAFRVSGARVDLWRRLARYVSADPRDDDRRLVVADSKKVFARNPRGERRLETTALAFLAQSLSGPDPAGRHGPASGVELLACAPEGLRPSTELLARHPWYAHLAARLPRTMEEGALRIRVARLARTLAAEGVEVLAAGLRAVPAGELNASFAETDNKALTHWRLAVSLVEHLWERFAHDGLDLVVDKLGGRMRYGPLLAERFPRATLTVRRETPELCEYRLGQGGRRMRLVFAMHGEERSFAVALGSCLAKYGREVCMEAFNRFFTELQPDLHPTAGYTSDGRRWLAEARKALERARLESALLIRER